MALTVNLVHYKHSKPCNSYKILWHIDLYMPHPYSRNLVSRTMNLKSNRNFTIQYNNTQDLAARLTVVTKVTKFFVND